MLSLCKTFFRKTLIRFHNLTENTIFFSPYYSPYISILNKRGNFIILSFYIKHHKGNVLSLRLATTFSSLFSLLPHQNQTTTTNVVSLYQVILLIQTTRNFGKTRKVCYSDRQILLVDIYERYEIF